MQLSQPRSVAEMRMVKGGDRRKHHRLFVATRPCRAETGKALVSGVRLAPGPASKNATHLTKLSHQPINGQKYPSMSLHKEAR